jgi:uncharacterized protein (TIGR03066 family)
MRASILTAVCGALLVSGLSAAPVPKDNPKDKEKTTEQKLIGKWKLVKSDQPLPADLDFFIEYKPKGALVFIRVPKDGEQASSEGKYKLDGDTKLEWTVNEGGTERGETSKIKTLTADKLILEDPDGIKEEFEKVAEKKEPKKDKPKKD